MTSLLNIFSLGFEIYNMQLISMGGEFVMINRTKLGYEVSSKKKKLLINEKANINDELETLKAVDREKKLSRQRYEIHSQMSSIKTATILSGIGLLICGLSIGLSYDLPPCGLNTYETGNGVCGDCLAGLGDTCKECTSQNYCSKCKAGYMQ